MVDVLAYSGFIATHVAATMVVLGLWLVVFPRGSNEEIFQSDVRPPLTGK